MGGYEDMCTDRFLREEIRELQVKNKELIDFVVEIGDMSQRVVTDNTTDEAEENGIAEKLRGFIAKARQIKKE